MARIKVEDLPQDMKVSKEEMKKVFGGKYELYPKEKIIQSSSGGYHISPQSIPWEDDVVRHLFTQEEIKG